MQSCKKCPTAFEEISASHFPRKAILSHKRRRSSPKNRQASEQEGAPQNSLCEKYLQYQQGLYHVFNDFKKAFYRVWHAALWATMKTYKISTNLIRFIKNLYDKAISAVLFNNSIGDGFRNSCSPTGMSTLTHPLQRISGNDHDRHLIGS